MLIGGGCHCGNIGLELEWPDGVALPARACGCTFCLKHHGVWTCNPAARLRVSVREAALVNAYRFGTRTAEFHVCRGCGVVPVVTSRIAGRLYAVVSVHALEEVAALLEAPRAMQFDGETEAVRLARRARYWIADVTFA